MYPKKIQTNLGKVRTLMIFIICAKFALVNAQSVRNRTALLLSDYVTSNNIDIACITETWFTHLDNVDIAVLQGNNYTLSHVMRDNIRGGGVGVLFKSTYKLLRSTPISCEAYEGINITLKHPNSTLITVVVNGNISIS